MALSSSAWELMFSSAGTAWARTGTHHKTKTTNINSILAAVKTFFMRLPFLLVCGTQGYTSCRDRKFPCLANALTGQLDSAEVCKSRAIVISSHAASAVYRRETGWATCVQLRRDGLSWQIHLSGNPTNRPLTARWARQACSARFPRSYFNFAYSALAAMRMGTSGSASFQSVRKS